MLDALHALRIQGPVNENPVTRDKKTAIVGCFEGNHHEMGLHMVRHVLESTGWRVVYLGANVPAIDLAEQQVRQQADLMCVSLATPQINSDIRRLSVTLALRYDPHYPYRLAIGGNIVSHNEHGPDRTEPFLDVRYFSNTEFFYNWTINLPA
jgi:methylmalonyl-CoA mutase cobalamin-binding subunit